MDSNGLWVYIIWFLKTEDWTAFCLPKPNNHPHLYFHYNGVVIGGLIIPGLWFSALPFQQGVPMWLNFCQQNMSENVLWFRFSSYLQDKVTGVPKTPWDGILTSDNYKSILCYWTIIIVGSLTIAAELFVSN